MSKGGGKRGSSGRGYGGDIAGFGGGNRWNNAGKASGGKGGRIPWSFVHAVDDADSLGLMALSQKIPDDWVDWKHGGKRSRDRLHTTLLLKMTEAAHLERLKDLARAAHPAVMTVRDLFCEHVDRITDADVFAIGVALSCPDLRLLKDSWNSEVPDHLRRVHVPYDGDGHITLAYIRGDRQREAEGFVEEHRNGFLDGRSLSVSSVSYQDEFGKEVSIALEGSLASRASKGARHDSSISKGASKGGGMIGKLIEIDGSVLEGGGQILRMSSAYAALFNAPIHIVNIRAGRKNPGLAAQHLESLRLVRDVSGGELVNDFVGSVEVSLQPGPLSPGSFSADPGTAGSITLMVQASLFPLLFAGGACSADLRGGTDVAFSPPLDFLMRVLLPSVARMGADFNMHCRSRGFFPRGGGHVQLRVPKLQKALSPIDLSERGEVSRAEVVLHTTRALGTEESSVIPAVRRVVGTIAPEVLVTVAIEPADRVSKFWVDIVVSTTTGALFHGGSEPQDIDGKGGGRKGGGGGKALGSLAERFASSAREASAPLEKQLASGAAVDEHLADQLVLPASLAHGTSRLLVAELSLHAQTAIHIAELIVPGAKFKQETRGSLSLIEVHGIGHTCAGMPAVDAASGHVKASLPQNPNEETIQLTRGALSTNTAQMIGDFKNDMGQLSEYCSVEVQLEIGRDCLILRGGPSERRATKEELVQILAFYKISIAS